MKFKQQNGEMCVMERALREIRRQVSFFIYLFYHGSTAPVGPGLLVDGVSRSLYDTHTYIHTLSVGILLTRDRPVDENFTRDDTTLTRDRKPFP